ncbi:MAG: hypothetical protein U9M95_03825 [Candidatus Altiarchaeota archaeon]|nr:hypothetical protein [Candidatus Altiarchaeota archaeon]
MRKIKTIDVPVNELEIYFKKYFELLEERLELARKLKDIQKGELTFLLCLTNIEGMAYAWQNKFNKNFNNFGERFTSFIEKFCDLPYCGDSNNRKHIWSTFRCSFAHMGMIDIGFINPNGEKEPSEVEAVRLDIENDRPVRIILGKYKWLSVEYMLKVFEKCINNFRTYVKESSDDFDNEYYMLVTMKCRKCGQCYAKSPYRNSCYFCGK